MLTPVDRAALAATRFGDVRWFAEIGSTNDWMLEQARAGAPEGLVAVADYQSTGRGRLDRKWIAPPGSSLMLSLLLRPAELSPSRLHLTTSAVALAAADAIWLTCGVATDLKWPNDLMVGERKVAGVLAESVVSAGAVAAVVVGVGINVTWPRDLPPEIAATATALNHHADRGRVPERAQVLVGLLRDLDLRLADWDEVARDYAARCVTVGRRVAVDMGEEQVQATATGVGADGRLELRLDDDSVRSVAAADVIHLR